MEQNKIESKAVIEDSTKPELRKGVSLLGAGSCAVFAWSCWLFVRNWSVANRIPIHRAGMESLNLYSGFLDYWSRVFPGLAILGCGLAVGGIFVGRKRRTLAFLGLIFNALALVALVVLGSTEAGVWL